MNVMIDLCIVPLGVGVSLSPYIAACEKVLAVHGMANYPSFAKVLLACYHLDSLA